MTQSTALDPLVSIVQFDGHTVLSQTSTRLPSGGTDAIYTVRIGATCHQIRSIADYEALLARPRQPTLEGAT